MWMPLCECTLKRREAERGSGDWSPGGFGRQPNVTPVISIKKEAVSEQNAKHSTIETVLC